MQYIPTVCVLSSSFACIDPQQAGLMQLLSETENMTLFVPSAEAISNLSQEDKDFWLSSSNLPSLVK